MARILSSIFVVVCGFSLSTVQARELDSLYKKEKIEVGEQKINVWIADDEPRREQGLMFIDKLSEDTGMLFVFDEEQPLGFWMKNTVIPLAIGFFNSQGVLIDIQEMQVSGSLLDVRPPTYQSKGPGQFALEMNKGWFARHKIKLGAKLTLLSSTSSAVMAKQLHLNKKTRQ